MTFQPFLLLHGEIEKTGPDAPLSDAALKFLAGCVVGAGAGENLADAVEVGVAIPPANRRFDVGLKVLDAPPILTCKA
jgi:hypothetical protein